MFSLSRKAVVGFIFMCVWGCVCVCSVCH